MITTLFYFALVGSAVYVTSEWHFRCLLEREEVEHAEALRVARAASDVLVDAQHHLEDAAPADVLDVDRARDTRDPHGRI